MGHCSSQTALYSNMFGHKTEQPRDFWSKRDTTSCDMSTKSSVDNACISPASLHLQNKNKWCSLLSGSLTIWQECQSPVLCFSLLLDLKVKSFSVFLWLFSMCRLCLLNHMFKIKSRASFGSFWCIEVLKWPFFPFNLSQRQREKKKGHKHWKHMFRLSADSFDDGGCTERMKKKKKTLLFADIRLCINDRKYKGSKSTQNKSNLLFLDIRESKLYSNSLLLVLYYY